MLPSVVAIGQQAFCEEEEEGAVPSTVSLPPVPLESSLHGASHRRDEFLGIAGKHRVHDLRLAGVLEPLQIRADRREEHTLRAAAKS